MSDIKNQFDGINNIGSYVHDPKHIVFGYQNGHEHETETLFDQINELEISEFDHNIDEQTSHDNVIETYESPCHNITLANGTGHSDKLYESYYEINDDECHSNLINNSYTETPKLTRRGPDSIKLKELLERTGYSHTITSGQRKYGGPPPDSTLSSPSSGCEVYCGKIPKDIYEDELIPLFENIGKIWDFRLMIDSANGGTSKGFAFVQYTDKELADKAVKTLNNYEIRPGKYLKLNISIPNLRLFVGNIPKSKGKDEIFEEFSKLTDGLQDVIVYSTPGEKRKNRGFCFLQYDSHLAASVAKKRLTNHNFLMNQLNTLQSLAAASNNIPAGIGNSSMVNGSHTPSNGQPSFINHNINNSDNASIMSGSTTNNNNNTFTASGTYWPFKRIWNCDIIVEWAQVQEEPPQETMAKVKVLYVSNLTNTVEENDIKSLFEKHGAVQHVKKVKDYAFVHFATREDALTAMKELDGCTELQGQEGILIKIALAKPPIEKKNGSSSVNGNSGGRRNDNTHVNGYYKSLYGTASQQHAHNAYYTQMLANNPHYFYYLLNYGQQHTPPINGGPYTNGHHMGNANNLSPLTKMMNGSNGAINGPSFDRGYFFNGNKHLSGGNIIGPVGKNGLLPLSAPPYPTSYKNGTGYILPTPDGPSSATAALISPTQLQQHFINGGTGSNARYHLLSPTLPPDFNNNAVNGYSNHGLSLNGQNAGPINCASCPVSPFYYNNSNNNPLNNVHTLQQQPLSHSQASMYYNYPAGAAYINNPPFAALAPYPDCCALGGGPFYPNHLLYTNNNIPIMQQPNSHHLIGNNGSSNTSSFGDKRRPPAPFSDLIVEPNNGNLNYENNHGYMAHTSLVSPSPLSSSHKSSSEEQPTNGGGSYLDQTFSHPPPTPTAFIQSPGGNFYALSPSMAAEAAHQFALLNIASPPPIDNNNNNNIHRNQAQLNSLTAGGPLTSPNLYYQPPLPPLSVTGETYPTSSIPYIAATGPIQSPVSFVGGAVSQVNDNEPRTHVNNPDNKYIENDFGSSSGPYQDSLSSSSIPPTVLNITTECCENTVPAGGTELGNQTLTVN